MTERSSRSSVQLDVAPDEQRSVGPAEPDAPFRILILGDFSGRANRGLATKLAGRRPVSVDRDNLDEVIAGMGVALRLPGVALQFSEMEDFHPDQIYRRAEIFRGLSEARASVQPAKPQDLLGSSLLDQMIEQSGDEPIETSEAPGDLAAFLKRAVAPHLVPREDPQVREQAARVQSAAGEVMRTILHHADFQAIEAAWRALFMLVRGLDTDAELKLYAFDATLRELADDPPGLAKLLTEQNEPWAVIVGNYAFGQGEEDAQQLGRLGKIAREAGAPFLAEALPPSGAEDSLHWQSLRQSPEARWIGLALPRFLLRLPYGKETSEVESFEFEEMPKSIHQDYLWGNPAFCCAYLLGQAFETYGWNLRPGAYRQIDGLPLHVYQDDGGPVMKPCAEVLLTEKEAELLMEQGIMPLASLKSQNAVLLVRFQSIAQPVAALSGRWSG